MDSLRCVTLHLGPERGINRPCLGCEYGRCTGWRGLGSVLHRGRYERGPRVWDRTKTVDVGNGRGTLGVGTGGDFRPVTVRDFVSELTYGKDGEEGSICDRLPGALRPHFCK